VIEFVPVDDLKPHSLNTKRCDDLTPLVESIRARGILQPVTATPAGRIVAGAHRHRAAEQLGLAAVPVCRTPNLKPREYHRALVADEHTRSFDARPDLRVVDLSPVDDDWAYGRMDGRVTGADLSSLDRDAFRTVEPLALRGHVHGAVIADPTGAVVDGWWWAVYGALTGAPVLVRTTTAGEVDVPQVAVWDDVGAHPAYSRFGVMRSHRRISPLWDWLLTTGTPGSVLDIGCGWGWHLGEVGRTHGGRWRTVGYEPYRRRRGAKGEVDRSWVRRSIRSVAFHVEQHGLFDHAVLDHVLFLTGDDDLAEAAVAAAASLLAPGGHLWVSNQHTRLNNVVTPALDDTRRFGVHGGATRYLFRTWSPEEIRRLLGAHFGAIEERPDGAARLYRATGPTTRDVDAVRVEFDLPWEDGRRPGVVDELIEVLPWT